jgi:hypothetical protein
MQNGSNYEVVDIPDMLDEVKEYRDILLRQLLIMMRICLKNIWRSRFYYRGRNQHCIKSCCNGYGYHSYDCWFFFLKNKGVQFMLEVLAISNG